MSGAASGTYDTPRQAIDLTGLSLSGRVLDIGGGGEGVIARHSGDRVAVIDILPQELAETPDIGLKIIMNACHLQFLDDYFSHVTCFYALMYMEWAQITLFLAEAYRVLKPGGKLWIWDAVIPAEAQAPVFVAQVEVKISNQVCITPGYGTLWRRGQDSAHILALCRQAGFTAASHQEHGQGFALCCVK